MEVVGETAGMMRIDVITIFPEIFVPSLTTGMVERARQKGSLEVRLHDLRVTEKKT